jgi:plastocyanin
VPGAGNTTRISVMLAKVNEGSLETGEAPAAEAQEAEPQVVDVALSNFVIDMPDTLPAGPTRFAITNNGQAPHNFVIEGNGQSRRLANNLQPGQSGFLNIDLEPGTYTIFCPVGEGGHRAQGMELTLTVQ